MAVWRIIVDSDTYRSLECVDKSLNLVRIIERFREGKPLADSWVPIAVRLYEGDEQHEGSKEQELAKPRGDFFSLMGGGIPVISEKALETLSPLIHGSVEFLPLECAGDNYYVVNVLEVADCLDHVRSRYKRFKSSGRIMRIEQYVFKAGCLDNIHIFRLPEIVSAVFVLDALKELVESNGLEGLIFTQIA